MDIIIRPDENFCRCKCHCFGVEQRIPFVYLVVTAVEPSGKTEYPALYITDFYFSDIEVIGCEAFLLKLRNSQN